MSHWVDLFVDAPIEIDAVAEELFRLTGIRFLRSDDDTRYTARKGDVVVELSEHRFLDDRRLPLSRYRYDLAARVTSASVMDSDEARMLRHVHGQVRAKGYPALLVVDLQFVIEEADERQDRNPAEVGG
jgi:hypothetical protein